MDQVLKVQISNPKSKLYNKLEEACFKSARLYNFALHYAKEEFYELGSFPSYADLHREIKYMLDNNQDCPYRRLPATISQETIRYLSMNLTSFKQAIADYNKNPNKYTGEPRVPHYLPKTGLYQIYFIRANSFSTAFNNKNEIVCIPTSNKAPELKGITFKVPKHLKAKFVKGIRIVPHHKIFDVEYIYEKPELAPLPDNGKAIAIDFGINNFITTVNNAGLRPFIVKGNVIKSINHSYNKAKAHAQSELPPKVYTSSAITKLGLDRLNQLRDQFHKITTEFVSYCTELNINTIVIGYNKYWKQKVDLGSKTNQKFVSIPYYKFKQILRYKAKLVGLNVIEVNEAYTSKCSSIDNETIRFHSSYAGQRITRGLFKSAAGILINADVNAAANILRKAGFNLVITLTSLLKIDSFLPASKNKSNPIKTTKVVQFGYSGC